MYFGIGVMSYALFPYLQIAALVFFLFQYHFIVSEEEKYLHKTFTGEFEKYTQNVPRFIPKVKAYKLGKATQPPKNLKAGLRSEKRTLQAFSLVILIILFIWLFRII